MYKGKWRLTRLRVNGVNVYKGKWGLTCIRVNGG